MVFSARSREIRNIAAKQLRANRLEEDIATLPDGDLVERFQSYRGMEFPGRDAYAAMPQLFALVREACRRTTGLRPYDVQMQAGMVMAAGHIAEMGTGEGKTLVAALTASILALAGKGVHVATVNAYLAERDHELMRPVYAFLGLSSALLPERAPTDQKRQAYEADITYGTGYEFGFDYLRDQLAALDQTPTVPGDLWRKTLLGAGGVIRALPAQRSLAYAIIDEVDSVLIDEAITPLIISRPVPDTENPAAVVFREADACARTLKDGEEDGLIGISGLAVNLTPAGLKSVYICVPDELRPLMSRAWHEYVEQALRAHRLFERDVDYLVRDEQVEIIDGNTGRSFSDRKWRGGLHQAVEAKEGVPVTHETSSDVSVSRQRFYRFYPFLSGMTGTALESQREFRSVYSLNVIPIPANRPVCRDEWPAAFCDSKVAMYAAVAAEIYTVRETGRPVLVGTRSVRASEELAECLKQQDIPYVLLNARQNAGEAAIIAQAGEACRVTIATNMAGRGADIPLGEGVPEAGGLHVIGVEFNDSRRINRQLAGRSGRQGEPGSYRFFVSPEDDLCCLERAESDGHATALFPYRKVQDFSAAVLRSERRGVIGRKRVMLHDKWLNTLKEYI